MSAILPTLVPALGWALLDFLWQGAAIGIAAALLLAVLRDARPQARYAVACAALALCAVVPLAALVSGLGGAREFAAQALPSTAQAGFAGGVPSVFAWQDDSGWRAALGGLRPQAGALAWIVVAWSLGASLCALRLLTGFAWVGDVRARARPVDAPWQQRMDALALAIGLGRRIELATATQVDGPVVAGWWRPVVLLPASLLTRMPTDLVEALLAHELAHVRRHDYLVNLVQGAIESLLFYHPVVWWLSRRIRAERELIADDLALRAIGEPRRLARALQQLDLYQATRAAPSRHPSLPRLLPAAHGGKLMSRIQRLVVRPQVATADWRLIVPLAGLALVALGAYAKSPVAVAPIASVAAASVATAPVDAVPAIAPVAPSAAGVAIASAAPIAFESATPAALPAPAAAPAPLARTGGTIDEPGAGRLVGNTYYSSGTGQGQRLAREQAYALVREGEEGMTFSGDMRDVAEVKHTRQHLHGDFLWFRRDGAGYVVQDPAVLARARDAWAPSEALGKEMETVSAQMQPHSDRMEALGKQMEALSKQDEPYNREMELASRQMEPIAEKQRVLGARMGAVGDKMAFAHNEAERDKLAAEMDALQAQMEPLSRQMQQMSATMQKHAAEMQRAHQPMEALGKQMEAASAPMKPLGDKMGELGKRQEALSLKADAEVRALIAQSLRDGKALPAREIR